MNYELAKQLKEAGFPIIEHTDRAPEPHAYGVGFPDHDIYYIPTLEQLIEACGERFVGLDRIDGARGWCAVGDLDSNSLYKVEEKTPTEAVAKLWIALQGNK